MIKIKTVYLQYIQVPTGIRRRVEMEGGKGVDGKEGS
jgi:hypothetical protein